jgi:hypothetical protein
MTDSQPVNKLTVFKEYDDTVPCSQRPTLSQSNLLHPLILSFLMTHFNIILLTMFRSVKWFIPFRCSDQNFLWLCNRSNSCYMSRLYHPFSCDSPNNICFRGKIMKLLIMYFSPIWCPVSPNIFLITLFSSRHNLCSSLKVWGQVTFLCKMFCKSTELYLTLWSTKFI